MALTSTISAYVTRKEPILLIGSVFFLIGFIYYYIPFAEVKFVGETVASWSNTISYFGLFAGTAVFCKQRILGIMRKRGIWWTNIVPLAMLLFFQAVIWGLGTHHVIYEFMLTTVIARVGAAAKALCGIYIVTAAYRSLRGRSPKAIMTIGLMTIMILRVTTLGEAISPAITPFVDWLDGTIVAGTMRVYTICISFGSLLLGIRMAMGRELRVFGRIEEGAAEA